MAQAGFSQGKRSLWGPIGTPRSALGGTDSAPAKSGPNSNAPAPLRNNNALRGNKVSANTARAYVLSRQKRAQAAAPAPEPAAPCGPAMIAVPLHRKSEPARTNGPSVKSAPSPKYAAATLEISTTEIASERARALLKVYQEHNARSAGFTINSITLRVGAPVPNVTPQVVGGVPSGSTLLATELATATGATNPEVAPRKPSSDGGWGATGAWGAYAKNPFESFTNTTFNDAPFAQLTAAPEVAPNFTSDSFSAAAGQEEDDALNVGALGESQASGLADLFARKLMELAAKSENKGTVTLPTSTKSWAHFGEPELTIKSLLGEALLEELKDDDPLVLQALAEQQAVQESEDSGAAANLASAMQGKPKAPSLSTLKHERRLNYGSLVSLPARLLHEFYAPSFGRGDVVIHDLWLNGQHLPLVVANARRGVVIVLLCSETYNELRANPQLVHQRKQYCVQLRQHFARSFCEPGNIYSYRDLLQHVHVVQCYLYVNERNVHAIFPPSTLKTYVVEGEASIHIRWPKQELLRTTCEYLERNFTHESIFVGGEMGPIGSPERSALSLFNPGQGGLGGRHGLKWLAQDQRVPYLIDERHERALLKGDNVSYQLWGLEQLEHRPSLFDRLKIRPIINSSAELRNFTARKEELDGIMGKRSAYDGQVYLPQGAQIEYIETHESIIMGPNLNNIKAPYKVKLTIKAKPSHDMADVELQPVVGQPNKLKILGIEHNLQRLKGTESLSRPRSILNDQSERHLLLSWGQDAYERARQAFLQRGPGLTERSSTKLGLIRPDVDPSSHPCRGVYNLGNLTQYEASLREYSCVHLDALQLTAVQNPAPLGLVLGVLGSGRTQVLVEKAVYSYVTLMQERGALSQGGPTAGLEGMAVLGRAPRVLILHYNLTLGAFIMERLKRHVVNLDLSRFTICALSIPEAVDELDLSSFDIVMVDEAQDVRPEFLFKLLTRCTKLRCCYLFADFCQNLYHTTASLSRLVLLLTNLNKVLPQLSPLNASSTSETTLGLNLGLISSKSHEVKPVKRNTPEANSPQNQAISALSQLLNTQDELRQAQAKSLAGRDLNQELTQCCLELSSALMAQLQELERAKRVTVRLLPLSYRLNPGLGSAVHRYKLEAFTSEEIGYNIGMIFTRYMSWEREQYQARQALGHSDIKGTLSLAQMWEAITQEQGSLKAKAQRLALPFEASHSAFNMAAFSLERLRSELVRTQCSRLARAFVQGEVTAQFQLRRPLPVTLLSFNALSQLFALPFAAAGASQEQNAASEQWLNDALEPDLTQTALAERAIAQSNDLSDVRLSVRSLDEVGADEAKILGALTIHHLSENALSYQRALKLINTKEASSRIYYLSVLEDMWQQVSKFCALNHGTHAIFSPLSRSERRNLSDELTTSWAVLGAHSAPLVYLDFMMRHTGRMQKTAMMMQSLEQRVLSAIGPELLNSAEQVLYHLQQRICREYYLIAHHHTEYLSWAVGPRYADSKSRLCAELTELNAAFSDPKKSTQLEPNEQAFLVEALLVNESLQESRAALNLEASLAQLSFLDDYAVPDKSSIKSYPISLASLCHDYNIAFTERSSTGSPLGRIKPRDDNENSVLQLLRLTAIAPTVWERIAKLIAAAVLALYAPSAKRLYERMLAAYLGIGTDLMGRHQRQIVQLFKSDLKDRQRQFSQNPANQALKQEIEQLTSWIEQLSFEQDPKSALLYRHSDREIITDLAVKAEAVLSHVKLSENNAFYKERFSVDNDHISLSTIHSFKGAEADKVALIIGDHKADGMTKELFYTGISRARQHLHILYRDPGNVARLARCTEQSMGELKCVADLGAQKEHEPQKPATTGSTTPGQKAGTKSTAAEAKPVKSEPKVTPAQFPSVNNKPKASSTGDSKTMTLIGTFS